MTAIASSSIQKERNIAIDLAKGICIILMVAGHAMYSGGWLGYFLILFRMPCFFIASGFLFKEKNFADPKAYIRRKFKGLYWPFVFWSLLFLSLHNLFARMHLYGNYLTINEILMGGKICLDSRHRTDVGWLLVFIIPIICHRGRVCLLQMDWFFHKGIDNWNHCIARIGRIDVHVRHKYEKHFISIPVILQLCPIYSQVHYFRVLTNNI